MIIPSNYINISEIAKQSGKVLKTWANYPVGQKKISEFKATHPEIEDPIVTKRGKGGGTYAHPELAAIFAAWCNPNFTAEVVKQNAQLKDQNALLKEKILTFQVNTPAQIAAAWEEAPEVKKMVQDIPPKDRTIEDVELIAKAYFAGAIKQHPKGLTFEQYFPHWLWSMRKRTDIYPAAALEALIAKAGKPVPYQGRFLKEGYTYAWTD